MKTHKLRSHPLYDVWNAMRSRCCNPRDCNYPRYGARGIAICWGWKEDFLNFYEWAIENGWKKGLQLDRKENSEGYYPWNCRFVTRITNSNNRRDNRVLTIFGETKTLAEWIRDRRCVVSSSTFRGRLDWKWKPEEALTTPIGTFRGRSSPRYKDKGKKR